MTQEEYNALSTEERKKTSWSDLPRATRNLAALFIGLCVIGIGTCMFGGGDKAAQTSSAAATKEIVYNSEWDGSVKQVEDYLKTTLNDAGSYESVEWGNVVKAARDVPIATTEDPYDTRQITVFIVRHQYRAKNAFGAMILKHEVFTLDDSGRVIEQGESIVQ
jgi:hypothetical protein